MDEREFDNPLNCAISTRKMNVSTHREISPGALKSPLVPVFQAGGSKLEVDKWLGILVYASDPFIQRRFGRATIVWGRDSEMWRIMERG